MKKIFFLVAVMFAAVAVNADEVVVDLSKYAKAGGNADDVTPSLAAGVLTVAYKFPADWGNGGVEFALNNLDVTNLAFSYKGDAAATKWVSFQVYLKDSKGGLWYSAAQDLCISSWNADWQNVSYMPGDVLWSSTTDAAPAKPFVALGFLANPENPTNASFAIKDVKLTAVGGTGIDKITNDQLPITNKVLRDGQLLIIRNGLEYNAAGQMVK